MLDYNWSCVGIRTDTAIVHIYFPKPPGDTIYHILTFEELVSLLHGWRTQGPAS